MYSCFSEYGPNSESLFGRISIELAISIGEHFAAVMCRTFSLADPFVLGASA